MSFCELCGRASQLKKAMVEGVLLQTCFNCSQHGNTMNNTSPNKREKVISRQQPELKIINNFSRIINSKREELHLTIGEFSKLINERESVVAKWIAGSLKPNLDIAAKLQKKLKLRLVEQEAIEASTLHSQPQRSEELTLGDLISIKTRKR